MASELQALVSQSSNMAMNVNELFFNDNSEEQTNITTVYDDYGIDNSHREHVNTKFQYPINAYNRATGSVFEAQVPNQRLGKI